MISSGLVLLLFDGVAPECLAADRLFLVRLKAEPGIRTCAA
jgi:hypothetical protein